MTTRPRKIQEALRLLPRQDRILGRIIRRVGPFPLKPLPPADRFASLVEAIVYQQLSGKAAATIFGRLLDLYPTGFPEPQQILRTEPAKLRGAGLSKQKLLYLTDLCRCVHGGGIDFRAIARFSDERVAAALTRVKGIGVWTAQMFLIFTLGRLDVLPTGDLGIRKAVGRFYDKGDLATAAEIEAAGQAWEPYRSIASWYLWASLDIPTLGLQRGA